MVLTTSCQMQSQMSIADESVCMDAWETSVSIQPACKTLRKMMTPSAMRSSDEKCHQLPHVYYWKLTSFCIVNSAEVVCINGLPFSLSGVPDCMNKCACWNPPTGLSCTVLTQACLRYAAKRGLEYDLHSPFFTFLQQSRHEVWCNVVQCNAF